MNDKERAAFEELCDEFEKFKRDSLSRIEQLEDRLKEAEAKYNGT